MIIGLSYLDWFFLSTILISVVIGAYRVRPEQLNCSNYNAIVCPPR
jgi:hypothetical protein